MSASHVRSTAFGRKVVPLSHARSKQHYNGVAKVKRTTPRITPAKADPLEPRLHSGARPASPLPIGTTSTSGKAVGGMRDTVTISRPEPVSAHPSTSSDVLRLPFVQPQRGFLPLRDQNDDSRFLGGLSGARYWLPIIVVFWGGCALLVSRLWPTA